MLTDGSGLQPNGMDTMVTQPSSNSYNKHLTGTQEKTALTDIVIYIRGHILFKNLYS